MQKSRIRDFLREAKAESGESYFSRNKLEEYTLRDDGRYEAITAWDDRFTHASVHIVTLEPSNTCPGEFVVVDSAAETRRFGPHGMIPC